MAVSASARTCLVVASLACALTLALRSADAQADEAQPSSPAQKPKCAPGAATPCRVGALRDPENQEEEGLFNVKARGPSGAADDDYSDPDQPKDPDQSDDDELVVLGH
ncbi:hypothetical protein D1007_15273 [Hordeum vulgare]|uniref:Uncharacterized protein n=1 Tax=Hordeum vulgare subsp. vulgare TaxID=112509 RepID=A0A8I6YFX1_HORVV|nr:uncharacterized protein LOC123405766 [Hordeum vulgare subsp. vulgare]KAE8808149.1 hypothetical protein D1007_15273 [Hordeum vulgare]KAI4982469.1 hypothetical protein ZWY2020_022961 [Hordeum vulgare]